MPYTMRKVKKRNCYRVKSKKRTHAKCTSYKKARAQLRLLNSLQKGGMYRQYESNVGVSTTYQPGFDNTMTTPSAISSRQYLR